MRRELRHEVRGQRRGVCKRLVERLGEGREEKRRVGPEHEFAVLRGIPLGDQARVGELVEGALFEPDRKGAQGIRALFGRECGKGRRVDSAREEHADRDVGDEVRPDRVAQAGPQLFEQLGLVIVAELVGRGRGRPGEALESDGRTWKLEAEFRARRLR